MSIRRLNEPVPAEVVLDDDGRPAVVRWVPRRRAPASRRTHSRCDTVEVVLDVWYVDDMWWTDDPIRRAYHECQLSEGARVIVMWDLVASRWFVQR